MVSKDGREMDHELAKRLFEIGGTLVLLNVPPGTDFGVDIKSWTTGEDFKGVKMIPPGFHYVHYSAKNEFGELAPRVGFIHIFKESELLVKKWEVKEEDFSFESIPKDTVSNIKTDLKNLDRFLGPYPFDMWLKWQELTSKVDANIVERCAPVCGYIRSALELEHCSDASRPRGGEPVKKQRRIGRLSSKERENQLLPDLKPKPGTELRLTELPDKYFPDGATPSEITQHSLDNSYALDQFLNKLNHPMEIIGELQLAFVCFLAGQSLDAFEHWKGLVELLCGADAAIPSRLGVYIEFLHILEIQLSYVPEEVLCDIVAGNNFVYCNLRKLFANIEQNSQIDSFLKSRAARMRGNLTTKFMWDFSHLQDDEEDEAPVVVELE
ncbi:protein AAR2 homolog isoform X2 [Orussus abietinus]|uniref:protein AAR2 homolog isoform X2 n=1 Tax=Orussus abietinus TaxID=222816 RepID=UPI000625AB0E|nr:protein AAR2 homolog isoform X2 [Orussus abietinus]